MTSTIAPESLTTAFNKIWALEKRLAEDVVRLGRACNDQMYRLGAYSLFDDGNLATEATAALDQSLPKLQQTLDRVEKLEKNLLQSEKGHIRAFVAGGHTTLQPLFDALAKIRTEKITDTYLSLQLLRQAVAPQDPLWLKF